MKRLVLFCIVLFLAAGAGAAVKSVEVYATDSSLSAVNDASKDTTTGTRDPNYDALGLDNNRYNSRTVIKQPGTAESAEDISEINVGNNLNITYSDSNGNIAGPLRILITLTLIAIAPMLIIMLTSFTRILVVMHFTRAAIGTQTAPPNQVLVGITLFLTFFIMQPTINEINTKAVVPFEAGEMTQQEFVDAAMDPLRDFMYGQTQKKDVKLFMDIAKLGTVDDLEDIPNYVLVPAFIISELRTAFIIGFLIYIPFIVIDMVVASTLMSMGMMMLPPTTMNFKVVESENTRLKKGDTFQFSSIIEGEPLYIDNLCQNGHEPIAYVCGMQSGVLFEII
ncbi:MAG: flagellar type III secretion system pore protein FliP [Lachnospiraceae bacterium]|nr:flagellar type III secretion system pore protein FliP [Lachnospiraceae bacterium]